MVVELHQDAVRVVDEDAADAAVGGSEAFQWSGQLHALADQLIGQGLHIWHRKGNVADAHLVQLDGFAVGVLAGVACQNQRRGGVARSVADVGVRRVLRECL